MLHPLGQEFGTGLELRYRSIEVDEYYDLLVTLEERAGDPANDIPVVFIGDRVLGGPQEIRAQFREAVEAWQERGGCACPGGAAARTKARPAADAGVGAPADSHPVYLAYFLRPGCKDCDRAGYVLERVQRSFPALETRRYNATVREHIELHEAVGQWLEVPDSLRLQTPSLVVGRTYLAADQITDQALEALVRQARREPMPPPWEEVAPASDRAREQLVARFRRFGPVAVALAGFLDGINPCAFATMLFLISYLTLAGHRGRDLLWVGGAFTLAVFLTYLLVGLGLFTFVQALSGFALVSRILFLVIAAFTVLLGFLSLYDFFRIRRGAPGDMVLQLPGFLRRQIHQAIRSRVRVRRYVLAAFVAGVVVSLLELACTGQIYLPTIYFVFGVPELRLHALVYLVLYNTMFVVPLVAVFALAYGGVRSARLGALAERHVGLVKLGTSVLFLGLGGALLVLSL